MPVITRSQSKKIIPESIPRNSKGYPSVGGLTLKKMPNKIGCMKNMKIVTPV